MKDVLLVVIGGLIAAFVSGGIEFLRRPKFTFKIATPLPMMTAFAPLGYISLRLIVRNESLPRLASWMLRGPALQSHGTINFRHLDGQEVFGKTLHARWASAPEPIPIQVIGSNGQNLQIVDYARFGSGSRIDIYPGEEEVLDVAVLIENDTDCYPWNNESYFHPSAKGRNPNWKLGPNRYLAEITVTSSGQKRTEIFRLINDAGKAGFRLMPPQPEDIEAVRAS